MKHANNFFAMLIAGTLGGFAPLHAQGHGHHGDDDHEAGPSDTLTGEVVDLACFVGHGSKGKDHAKCAKQCIQKGLPVGLLTERGEIFFAVQPDHKKANDLLAPKAAKTITVVGKIKESSGVKMIEIHQVLKK